MARVAVELVPRRKDTFLNELRLVKNNFTSVDTMNIPDIIRYEISSLEAAKFASSLFSYVIPHIRAGVLDKSKPLPFKGFLRENKIKEVLVVFGDEPNEESANFSPCTSIDLIKKFKNEAPEIKVYAAIDQYRSNLTEECDYVKRKIDAGADGFFTQPFFDLKLIELYWQNLKSIEVFWGVSPAASERSRNYWQKNNNVKFPSDFKPTLEWNRKFAKAALDFIKANNSNIYFMPIKADVIEYLSGIIE
jgi:methylenetetrahydrofolate reductase (NADPH)